jgi:hypothetical protein
MREPKLFWSYIEWLKFLRRNLFCKVTWKLTESLAEKNRLKESESKWWWLSNGGVRQ